MPAPALLALAAPSGTGKTTLLEALLPLLEAAGLRVAVLKHHAHPDRPIDVPGKDSHRLRQAGARRVLLASDREAALFTALAAPPDPRALAAEFLGEADLVLVEGFRGAGLPTLLLRRAAAQVDAAGWAMPVDVIAVVTDEPASVGEEGVPVLPLHAPEEIAAFVVDWISEFDRSKSLILTN